MVTLRDLRWPDDREALCALDTSFTTGRVYHVIATHDAFALQEATVSPPLHKVYRIADEIELFPTYDRVVIAEGGTRVVGVAALCLDAVDRRAIVQHLYVAPEYRGRGIGRALMEAMLARAQQLRARCLWLETQDVNYRAINFYRHAGFQWCGLDLSLDERTGAASDETAVFFMRTL